MTSHVGSPLYVVAVVSNPVQYASRFRLFRQFQAEMKAQPVELYVAECAFGARPFEVTEPGNPKQLQRRSHTEIWLKENLINETLKLLPHDWQYVAWIDGDVSFQNPNWVKDTLDALQHWEIVQLWQNALDMGPTGQLLQAHTGFGYQYATGVSRKRGYEFWHPGFAWAANRDVVEGMGGLMDAPAILGAADHHMALAIIGEAEDSMPGGLHPNYRAMVFDWQAMAQNIFKRDMGFVPGTLLHHWHGKKADRRYQDRWKILLEDKFDPRADIRRDAYGLLTFSPGKWKLRDDVRRYFRARNEDSIDVE